MKEELKKLIELAQQAGYIYGIWCDGGNVSNDEFEDSKEELEAAEKAFLEKFGGTVATDHSHIKCNYYYTDEAPCQNDAIEKWERVPGKLSIVIGEKYLCQNHIDRDKKETLETTQDEESAADYYANNIKITKL